MKTSRWVIATFPACLLLFAGCSKSGKPVLDAREYYGVKVNSPRLETDFINASPEVQASVEAIKRSYRYGRFPQAIVELDRLSGNPSLSEVQKKLVNDLIDQTKQVITKAPQTAQ
jgi:hypothetical protein